MYPKFNLSRTSIVILTVFGTIVCAAVAFVAFEQWPAENATVRPVDTTLRPNDSSETEVNGGVDGPVALRGDEGSKPLKPETHESPADERSTTKSLINPFMVTPPSKNGSPAWPQDEKQPERRSTTFNQSLISSLDRTKSSAVIPDLMESVRAGSTVRVEEPQRKNEGREEKGPRGDQPDEAMRFRNMQLQDENGDIPLDGLQKAREQMDVMRARQQKKAKAAGKPDGLELAGINPGSWTWLGPGNVGGRIRSIVIDPVNANKMWVGSVSGGIWRTTDAGGSWAPVTGFFANLAVSTMVIDPTNSSIMYAGTGESFAAGNPEGGNISPDGLRGDGVFKSTDGGTTWTQLQSTKTSVPAVCATAGPVCPWSYVNRLAMSLDGSTILAATITSIRISTDGGANWSQAGGVAGNAQDIDFDPVNSQLAVASGNGTSFYSTDGGQNWLQAAFTPAITGRVEIAYAPSSPNIVYASVNQNNGEVYRSINGGQNFNQMDTTGNNYFLGGGNQGGYDNIIWVNPRDPTFVIVGGISLWLSTDSGTNFTQISTGTSNANSAHPDHHMIVASPGFDNNTNKTVYFGNDGGIYRTDDVSTVSLTSGWVKLNNGLGVTQFYGAAANSAGVIWGGTQDNGTVRYTPNTGNTGGVWDGGTGQLGGDGGFAAADPTDTNYFYGEYINLGILRSTNGGTSASYIYCNPVNLLPSGQPNPNGGACVSPSVGITDAFNGANFIAPFILDPNNANTMLAGGLSLWRSNDIKAAGFPTWLAIKPPAPNGAMPPVNQPISAITVSPNNPDFIVVGHNNGQIYITFDGTGTNPSPTQQPPGQPCPAGFSPCWSRIDKLTTPGRFVTRLVIDETRSPNWIYATFGGFADNNIYVTKDLGSTWTDVTGGVSAAGFGLPDVPVRSLIINPVRANFLYVGTEVGIFASEDGGATWGLTQDGPANVSVDELFWLNGDLVAVTHGRGLYKTSDPVYAFNFPNCIAPPNCACAGNWNCGCMWPGGQIPTINDDVNVSCAMTVNSPAQARNVTVGNFLTLNNSLTVAEDVYNVGNIRTTTGGGSLSARNLVNSRLRNAYPLGGVISLPGGLSASGDVTNAGIIALGEQVTNFGSLTTFPNSTLTLTQLNVARDVRNNGLIQGGSLVPVLVAGGSGAHTFSGSGEWKLGTIPIFAGQTVSLGSDVTFEAGIFSNGGTLDVRNKTLTFTGGELQSGGTVLGTGTIRFAPISGNSLFSGNGPAVTIASGTVEYRSGGAISGPLTIDAGATFRLNLSNFTANGGVTVNGTLNESGLGTFNFNGSSFTNNGSVTSNSFRFNNTAAPLTQSITGTGTWAGRTFMGGPATSSVTLQNDVTFASLVQGASTLNVNGRVLTHTGASFTYGSVVGSGTVRMQPVSGASTINGIARSFAPDLKIVSGTVTSNDISLNGSLTVDPGATLSLAGFGSGIGVRGNVTNNGTVNVSGSGSPTFSFQGNTFTNNGSVATRVFFTPYFGAPAPFAQNLAGTGSWTGAGTALFHFPGTSILTLLNDVTYAGEIFYSDGRINTGAFTLSLPCTTAWQGAGDVVGNVRRTNLAACPGAAFAFGSPFTTIQFTSGTPPTEITVNVGFAAPAGFPNAARRTYLITPFGGSGYTATLRLHYLDSELNGNAESSLQLWRNNGANWTLQGATNRDTTNNWVEYSGVTQFSPWTISGPLAPTAASVSVSGQVRTASGAGIRNAVITLTAQDGSTRIARSSSFGYYRFDNVIAGETYIVSISTKRFTFSQPTIVVGVFDEIAGLDFVADQLP